MSGCIHLVAETWKSNCCRIYFFPLLYEFRESNLGYQAWWQAHLPVEPSHQPRNFY